LIQSWAVGLAYRQNYGSSRVERPYAHCRYKAGQHDTGEANHHRETPRDGMSRCQIAVTDDEASHEGKIQPVQGVPHWLSRDVPYQKPQDDHSYKKARQDRPNDKKLLTKRHEKGTSDLPPHLLRSH